MGRDKEEKESKQRAQKRAALEVAGGILEARGGQSFTGGGDGLDQMLLSPGRAVIVDIGKSSSVWSWGGRSGTKLI